MVRVWCTESCLKIYVCRLMFPWADVVRVYVCVAIAQGCGVEASGAVLVLNFLAREFLRSFER